MCGDVAHTCTLIVLEGSSRKQDPSRMLHASATCRRAARLYTIIGAHNAACYESFGCLVIVLQVVSSCPQVLASNAAMQPHPSTPDTDH